MTRMHAKIAMLVPFRCLEKYSQVLDISWFVRYNRCTSLGPWFVMYSSKGKSLCISNRNRRFSFWT